MQPVQCAVEWVQLRMCLGYSCMPHAHPRASSWAVVSPFMVPCVPTGMKTGSSTCSGKKVELGERVRGESGRKKGANWPTEGIPTSMTLL
jgi:hypothetical protein